MIAVAEAIGLRLDLPGPLALIIIDQRDPTLLRDT